MVPRFRVRPRSPQFRSPCPAASFNAVWFTEFMRARGVLGRQPERVLAPTRLLRRNLSEQKGPSVLHGRDVITSFITAARA
mmetsp:Transcript_2021/g.5293  ORF Transcript_2021/g.5293 Transcript_2021/m.5293 type:complete len:81 (-) Transcript_2021:113-355(-)